MADDSPAADDRHRSGSGSPLLPGGRDLYGIVLSAAARYPAARDVFTEEELDERLRAMARRILVEEARLQAPAHRRGADPLRLCKWPRGWGPEHLVVVRCSMVGCGRELLAEGCEPLRRLTDCPKFALLHVLLPPPVAGRVRDRPVCCECL